MVPRFERDRAALCRWLGCGGDNAMQPVGKGGARTWKNPKRRWIQAKRMRGHFTGGESGLYLDDAGGVERGFSQGGHTERRHTDNQPSEGMNFLISEKLKCIEMYPRIYPMCSYIYGRGNVK